MRMNVFRTAFLVTSLVLGGGHSNAQTLSSEQLESFSSLPSPEACRLIDYEEAEIVGGFAGDTWFLAVSGEKPWLTMEVQLAPHVYVEQPEFWTIELVGCQSGIGLPTTSPFLVTLQVDGLGTAGVEIRGANKSEQLQVPPQ